LFSVFLKNNKEKGVLMLVVTKHKDIHWWRRMEKITWTDHVRNEEVLFRVKEQRNILHEIRKRKANWRRGYSHLKEEALDRTMWRARFGRGFGPVVRQTAK
jgi:hypothetical protein